MKVAKELDLPLKNSKRGERMKTEQMDAGSSMATHLYTIVPPVFSAVTYIALSFAETVGAIDPINIWEKFGIGGIFGLAVYWFIRYLLNDKAKKDDKIEQMHQERLEIAEKQNKVLEGLLREMKDGNTTQK